MRAAAANLASRGFRSAHVQKAPAFRLVTFKFSPGCSAGPGGARQLPPAAPLALPPQVKWEGVVEHRECLPSPFPDVRNLGSVPGCHVKGQVSGRSPHSARWVGGWEQRVSPRAAQPWHPHCPPRSSELFPLVPAFCLYANPSPSPSPVFGDLSTGSRLSNPGSRRLGASSSRIIGEADLGKGQTQESPSAGEVETTVGLSLHNHSLEPWWSPEEEGWEFGGGTGRVRRTLLRQLRRFQYLIKTGWLPETLGWPPYFSPRQCPQGQESTSCLAHSPRNRLPP